MARAARFVRGIVLFIVNSVILSVILTMVLLHFFGTSDFTCKIDDQEVAGCKVEHNGQKIGETPLTTKLGFGIHKVVVTPPKGVKTYEGNRSWGFLTSGIGAEFRAEFSSADIESSVTCLVSGREVQGCQVEVDGRYYGDTPLQLTLTPGEHEVIVIAPDHPVTVEPEWVISLEGAGEARIVAKFTAE